MRRRPQGKVLTWFVGLSLMAMGVVAQNPPRPRFDPQSDYAYELGATRARAAWLAAQQ